MIGQSGVAVDVELVERGMTVIALDLDRDTDADLQDVRGGTVVAVDTTVDPGTGEVQRLFRCVKQWRRQIRWSTLRADEVREVLPYNSAVVRSLVRAMARQVADSKGVLLSDERRLIDAMAVLREVL